MSVFDACASLRALLPAERFAAFEELRAKVAQGGFAALQAALPALPRRVGRDPLSPELALEGDCAVDLGAWRACDAAALELLHAADAGDEALRELHAHGDIEERAMVLRALACRPVSAGTVLLLGEVQRTNVQSHFEAAVCDSNLVSRALGRAGFAQTDLDRLVLKAAFLGIELARLIDVQRHANPELSRMLQDLATEREAAGRAVWRDTARLIARAPTAGTLARLIGGLEHGDDGTRLAAAEGFDVLLSRDGAHRAEFSLYLRERLPREPRADIRAALERALAR
jgi:hypothetical protein